MAAAETRTLARTASAQKPRLRLRKLWLTLHLYLGLFAGAVFVLIGLTGSILAFREQIDRWLNPDLLSSAEPHDGSSKYRPLDEILAAAKAAMPQEGTAFWLHLPAAAYPYCDLIYFTKAAHGPDHRDYHQIAVNPYTATVTGQRLVISMENPFAEPFTMLIMDLHYTLLLGDIGATGVGFIALFMFGSLTSGIILFWPWPGRWRQALTIKWGATKERFVFDLHRTTGAYVCLVLAVMLSSGIYLIFGSQVRALVRLLSPIHQNMVPEDLKSEPPAGRAPIGLDAVAAIVNRVVPDGELMSMQLPESADGVYIAGKHSDNEVYQTETWRRVAVDQYSGSILYIQDPKKFTDGEKFLEWQYPLHSGEAFGNTGRAFILLTGFVPLTLYVTGFIRWRQKRRTPRR